MTQEKKLYVCVKPNVSELNSFPTSGASRFGGRCIPVGTVFEEPPCIGLGTKATDFEAVPDPRAASLPKSLMRVRVGCEYLLDWIDARHIRDSYIVRFGRQRLRSLVEAAAMMPEAPAVPFDAVDVAPRTVAELVTLVKTLRDWAREADAEAESEDDSELPPNESRVKLEDVPAALRESKKTDGEVLTVPYLIDDPQWPFGNKVEFTRAYDANKLTYRLKVGRAYAYLYDELSAMWRDNSLKD